MPELTDNSTKGNYMRNLLEYKGSAVFAKRVIASVLVFMLLNFEAVFADITPNTGNFNTNTNVSTDGNMTNITGGYINGDTGFHHFSEFDISKGHIVNQIFGNANRFVNLVDNRVLINGIFNAIKNGQINGDVVFVSPMGIFVGESGIMNVGSLQTIAPTQQTYQTLINEGQAGSLIWDGSRFNALELNKGDDYEGTQISGKIFARNGVNIRDGKLVNIDSRNEADIVSGFNDNGFAKTSGIAFADGDVINLSGVEFDRDEIINEQGVVDAQFMDKSQTGAINIYGQTVTPGRRPGGLIQSTGDVNIRGVDLGGRIEIANKIDAAGNVNIGNEFGGDDSGASANAFVDSIIIHDDVSSGKNVNIKSTLVIEQKEGSTISAMNDSTGTPTGDIAMETRSVSLGGNVQAGGGISMIADVKQSAGSEISAQGGTGDGNIVIVGDADLQKVHNEKGDISITGINSIVLNDTVSTGAENTSISLAVAATGGSISQNGDITAISTPGSFDVTLGSGVTLGSVGQAIKTNVGGNISIEGPGVGYAGDVYLHGVESDMNLGNIIGTGALTVTADKALNINGDIDDLSGNVSITAANGITQAEDSYIELFDDADKPGNISITNTTSGDISLQEVTAGAGDITVTNSAENGNVSLNSDVTASGTVTVSSAGDIAQTEGAIETEAGVSMTAGGSITQGVNTGIDAGTSVSMTAGENITQETGAEIIAGTTADLNATGTLNTQNVDSQGNITLSGESIAINELISTESGSISATATNGSITQTIADKALDAGSDITLSAANGDIGETDNALQLNSGGTVTMTGNNITVDSPGADVSFGTITANGDVKLSTTAPVPANMTVGNITGANSLNINSAGSLTMNNTADNLVQNNIDITAADGITQNAGSSLTSANGEINITNTTSGDASLQKITAQNGPVTIANSGGKVIVNNAISANPDYDVRVTAKGDISQTNSGINGFTGGNIYLESQEGAIGSKDNYITFERGEGKDLYATALNNENGSVFLRALDGDLELDGSKIKFSKDIGLASDYSVILTGDLTTPNGGIYIDSGEQFTLEHNLQANTIIDIKTSGGFTQGENANITAGEISIANAETGDIILNSLIANTGNITVSNTATDTGNVNFNKAVMAAGDISVSAQNDVLQNNESAILTAGNNITLNSTAGNIGADGNAMRVDANGKVNISANGAGDGKGNAWLTSADKNLTLGAASAANDLNVTTTGTNASITTGDAINAGNVYLNSSKDVTIENTVNATQNIQIDAQNGAVAANGLLTSAADTTINADGQVDINAGISSGADTQITTNSDLNVSSGITSGQNTTLDSLGFDLKDTGSITSTAGTTSITADTHADLSGAIVSGTDTNVTAGGFLSVYDSITSGNNTTLNSSALLSVSPQSTITSTAGKTEITSGESAQISGNVISGTDTVIDAKNSVTISSDITSTGNTTVKSGTDVMINGALSSGGTTNIDAGSVTVNDTGSIASTGKAEIISDNDVSINGAVSTDADAYISGDTVTIGSTVTAATGAVIEAASDVVFNDLLSVTGGNASVSAGGNITQNTALPAAIQTSGTVALTAGNSIGSETTPLKIAAGGAISGSATTGSIDITGVNGDTTFGTLTSGMDIRIASETGRLTLGDDLTAQNGLISVTSAKDMVLDKNLTAKNDITITAAEGINHTDGAIASSSGSVNVTNTTSGDVTVKDISGSNINVTNSSADADVTLAGTLSGDTASGKVTVTSQRDIKQSGENIAIAAKSASLNAVNGSIGAKPPTGGSIKVNVDTIDASAANGSVYLDSPDHDLTLGTITAAGDIDIKTSGSSGDLTINNELNGNTIVLGAANDLIINGILTSEESMSLSAVNDIVSPLMNTIFLYAGTDLSLSTNTGNIGSETGAIGFQAGGNVSAAIAQDTENGGNIYLFTQGQNFNAADIKGYKTVSLDARDMSLILNGAVSGADLVLNAAQDITFNALASATNSVTAAAAGVINQNAGLDKAISAGGNIALSGTNIGETENALDFSSGGTVDVTASTGAINVNSVDSDVTFGTVSAGTDIKLGSSGGTNGGKITLSNDLTANNGSITIDSAKDLELSKNITASGKVTLNSNDGINQTGGLVSSTGSDVEVGNTSGSVTLNNISGANITVHSTAADGTVTVGGLNAAENISVSSGENTVIAGVIDGQDITIGAAGNITQNAADTFINAAGNVNLTSQTGNIGSDSQAIMVNSPNAVNASISQNSETGGNIYLASEQDLFKTGNIAGFKTVSIDGKTLETTGTITGGDVILTALNTLTHTGTITATGSVIGTGADITANGSISGNNVELTATNAFTNAGEISGTESVDIAANSIAVNNTISGGNIGLTSDTVFENTGEIRGTGTVDIEANSITAGGAINGRDVALSSSTTFENTAAITGTNSVDIDGNSVTIGDTVQGGDVSVTSGTDINANAEISGGNITLTAAQKLNNTAAITGTGTVKADAADIDFDAAVSGADITLIADNTITNSASITGSGTVSAEAADITLGAGLSGNDVDLTATGTLTNNAQITGTNSVSATASNIQINELISGGTGGVSLDAVNDIKQSSTLDKSVSSTGAITLEGANIGEATNRLDVSSPTAINANATTGSVHLNGAEDSVTFGEITAAQNIDLSSNGDIVMNNDLTTDGGYIRVESGKGLSVSNSMTASGDVTIIAQEAINQTSGTITSTGGDVSVSNTTGNITLNAIGAELGTLNVTANGGSIFMNGDTTAGTSIALDSKTGDVTIGALMQATAGNITVNAGNNILQDASADVGLKTDGTITLTAGNSVGSQESKLDVQAGQRVDVTATTGSVNINSVNTDISFGTISAGTNIDISSTGADAGNISFTNDLNANGYINLDSSKNLDMSKNITATGDITLAANDGITQGGLIQSTQEGDISITNKSTGNVTLQKVTANSGSISVNNNAEGGNVQLTDVLNAGGSGNISVNAQNDISQTTSGNSLIAGGDITLNSESGNIGSSSNNIILSSGGVVSAVINQNAGSNGNIYLTSNDNPLTTGEIQGYQNVVLNSNGGNFTAGGAISGGLVDINSTGSVTMNGSVTSDTSVNIDSATSAAINENITAGTTVDIIAANGSLTQAAGTTVTGNGNINISASGGDVLMSGALNSTAGGVSVVNNTTGTGSMTVHDVSAAENINIENRGDGLLSLTGTIDNAKDLTVTASNTGANTGVTTSGTINNRGNTTIENNGQLGSNIGGQINNNLVNDADGETSTVTVNNRAGALNITAHVINGTVRGSQNKVVFENWGPGGLHFLPDSVMDNHGVLRFLNHAGDMTLYGTLINRFESDSDFISDTAVEDPDADVVIGMKLENWGNEITYSSNGQGSLIVDENASLSNFSVEADGVTHTGVINLENSGDSGEAGGGIIINGTINNGMVSDGTLVDNDGNIVPEGQIASGGIINIINEGTGVAGSGNTDDFGIQINETAKINNYAEMNIENKSGNGSITIAGTLGGDKGSVLQGGSQAPVPGFNIKNEAQNGGISFKNTASGDLKGMDLNITNSGTKGIEIAQGADIKNNADLTVTNTGGQTTIAGALSGANTTVNAENTGINVSGSLGASDKLTVNTANSTAQITGSLTGNEVDLDANTVNLGVQSTVSGTTSVDIDSAGTVTAAGAVNGGNIDISAGGLADITGSVEGEQVAISGNGVNVNNVSGLTSVIIGSTAGSNIVGTVQGATVDIDAEGLADVSGTVSGTDVSISGNGVNTNNVTGTSSVTINSSDTANINGTLSGGTVDIEAQGLADIKGAVTGTDISIDANGINIANSGSLTGTGTVDLNSLAAAINAQGGVSGSNVYVDGLGVTLENVTAQNALTVNSYTEKTTINGTVTAGSAVIDAVGFELAQNGSITTQGLLDINSEEALVDLKGDISAVDVTVDGAGINAAGVTGTNSVALNSSADTNITGNVQGGSINIGSTGKTDVTGNVSGTTVAMNGNGVSVGSVTGTTSVKVTSQADTQITGTVQGGSVDIDSTGKVEAGTIAGTDVSVDGAGIKTGDVTGTTSVALNSSADTNITGNVQGGSINIGSTGKTDVTGNVSGTTVAMNGNGVSVGSVTGTTSVKVTSQADTQITGTVQGGSVDIDSTGKVEAGTISGTDVSVDGAGIKTGDVTGTTSVALNSSADTNITGNVQGGSVDIDSTGKTSVTGAVSGTDITINGDGVSLGGDVTGEDTVSINTYGKDFSVLNNIVGNSVNITSGALNVSGSVISDTILGINTNNNAMTVSGTVSGVNTTLDINGLSVTNGGSVLGTTALDINSSGALLDVAAGGSLIGGNVDIDSLGANIAGSVSGTSVTVNTNGQSTDISGSIAADDITLNTNGLTMTGTMDGSNSIDVNSSGALVDMEGNITGGNISIDGDGVSAGLIDATGFVEINAGDSEANLNKKVSGTDITVSGTGVNANEIEASGKVDVNAGTKAANLNERVSGTDVKVSGTGVNASEIAASGTVGINAGTSQANLNGSVTGTDITVDGTGVNVKDTLTGTGNIDINSANDLVDLGAQVSGNDICIDGLGVNVKDTLTGTGNIDINSANGLVDLGAQVSGNDISIDGLGVNVKDTLTGTGNIDINSANGLVDLGAQVSGNDISIDGLGVNVKDTITGTGSVDINSENALVDVDAEISGADVAIDGKGIDLGASISGTNSVVLDTHGELLDIVHTVQGGNITINSNGLNVKNTITGTGAVDINSAGGLVDIDSEITGSDVAIDGLGLAIDAQVSATGAENAGVLNLNANGQEAVVNADLSGREVRLNANGVQLAQDISITGSSLVDIIASNAPSVFNGTVSGGNINIQGNLDIFGNVDGTGTVSISGLKNLGANITGGGKVSIGSNNLNMNENTNITSDSDVELTNTGALTMNSGTSVSGSSVKVTTGSLSTTDTSSLASGGSMSVSATGDINHAGKISGTNVEVSGANIDVKSAAEITGTGTTNVRGTNRVNVDGVIKGSDVSVTSGSGGVYLAHNRADGNIIADDNLRVSSDGNIVNGSVNGVSAIADSIALVAGGDVTLEGNNIGVLDSTLGNIKQDGFVLDNTVNSIHINSGGTLSADASGDLNLRGYGSGLNISDLNADNALLNTLNGSITADKISTAGELYMLAGSEGADISVNALSSGGKLTAEANRNINLNSTSELNIDSLYSKAGSIAIVSDGNTSINEIAAPEDISITVNDEKLSITNLGRVERDTNTIPKTVSLTVKDANRGVENPNSKLDILNAYVRNKVNLRADTITAQVYDNVTGQKRPNATGFHNANQNGEKLVFDVQGANYEQPETEGSLNPYYEYDADDKRALDVNITIGDSVGDAVYGAHFDKLYADYSYIDAVNEADPQAVADLVFDSIITGKHAVFKNNMYRIETINTETPHEFGQDRHYGEEAPDRTLNTKVSYNLNMNDSIDVGPIPEPGPDPGPDPGPGPDDPDDPDDPDNPDHPDNPDNPDFPDYPWPPDPDNPPPSNPEQGGGKVVNPHRHEHNISKEKGTMITTIDKRNQVLLHGSELDGLSWTIKDLEGEVLGSSSIASQQVVVSVKNLSKDGMTVSLSDSLTKDREVIVDLKYDYVPFSAKGVVEVAKKNSAYIRFTDDSDKACEKMINYMKVKKTGNTESL